MPGETRCQLDRALDPATRTPTDFQGVRCLYMDGQPSDACTPDFSGGWHTIVAAAGSEVSEDLRQEENQKPFFTDLPLRKWAGATTDYRAALIDHLAAPLLVYRLRLYALSYREDIALRAWPRLLEWHFGGPTESQYLEEVVNRQNQARMVRFPSMPEVGPQKLNSVVPIFIMAEHLAALHCEIEAVVRSIPQPYAGLLVFSDKIGGDGIQGHPKVLLLNSLLQCWFKDQIRVRNYLAGESKSGEFMADNAAGILTAALADRFHAWRNPVRAMAANHLLIWNYLDHRGQIRPISMTA